MKQRYLILISLVVLVALGVFGRRHYAALPVAPSASSSTPIVESPAPEPEPLALYQNDDFGITLPYPEGLETEFSFVKFHYLSDAWRVGARDGSRGQPLLALPLARIEGDGTGIFKSYPMYYDAELRIGVSTDIKDVAECLTGGDEVSGEPKKEIINGTEFTVVPVGSAAMMQYLTGTSFRTVRGNACIAIEALRAGSSYRDASSSPEDIPDEVLESYYEKALELARGVTIVPPK